MALRTMCVGSPILSSKPAFLYPEIAIAVERQVETVLSSGGSIFSIEADGPDEAIVIWALCDDRRAAIRSTFVRQVAASTPLERASAWVGSFDDAPRPAVPTVRLRFGLTAAEACGALRNGAEIRARRRAVEIAAEREGRERPSVEEVGVEVFPLEAGGCVVEVLWRRLGEPEKMAVRTRFVSRETPKEVLAGWDDEIPVLLGDEALRLRAAG